MRQVITETLVERARRLYAKRGILLSPAHAQESLRNLAKLFQQLNRGGQLLTDAAGNPAFCYQCGVVIFAIEGYRTERGGIGAARSICEQCAAKGGGHD